MSIAVGAPAYGPFVVVGIPVVDPFGVVGDPALPSLALALDPVQVQWRFGRGLPRLSGERGFVHLLAIRVTRHKPGRRCIVEYDVLVERPDTPPQAATLVGKVRRRRSGEAAYRLASALWQAGFGAESRDGVSVPEPIGLVPDFQMWLQRKVPGRPAADLLSAPGGTALARRIAEATHKLHRAGVPAARRHTMEDEVRILRERLPAVAREQPRWSRRIERLLDACDRLGRGTPEPVARGIHRDFYPEQVLVDGTRLYVIDFDEYCEGDPGLDIGNFLGHITEHSLRTVGNPGALLDLERALEERFIQLSGEATRPAVRAYATLTLARHVYLSAQFPERRPFTASLLELCEERLVTCAR